MRLTDLATGFSVLSYAAGALAGPIPSFHGLGFLAGGNESFAFDVAPDGSAVVGRSEIYCGDEGFLWMPQTGMVRLGHFPGMPCYSTAQAVSAAGSVVAGAAAIGGGPQHAFLWTEAAGMVDLGDLPGGWDHSGAYGISADGSIVVGTGDSGAYEAFRWTAEDGMVGLGFLPGYGQSGGHAVSADGSVIVGASEGGSERQAFRWSEDSGMVGLGDLPGGVWPMEGMANGVSADGCVVVGYSESSAGIEAFRWTEEEGMAGLGDLPGGYVNAHAFDANGDGSVIVGYGTTELGEEAFIWEAQNGMRNLKGVLETDYDLDLTGWQLTKARGISDDGCTLAGYAINASGHIEAWVAYIPEPRMLILTLTGVVACGWAGRRR